jgi:heme-degrading monooxygenase HmoA
MYIRTTRFQVKKSAIAKFQEMAEFAKGRAATLDGLLQNYLAIDDSGKGVMIGIWESKDKLTASLPAVKANWADAMENLEGQLELDEYPTVAKVKG